jgi:hypothetical protein
MYAHHQQSIENVTAHFKNDLEILALLLGGSIAHGFAAETSDVDVMAIVSDENHQERLTTGRTTYSSPDPCTYPGGYVDLKYISPGFMQTVRDRGSDPARFAFQDARVLYSHIEGIEGMLDGIARFPLEQQAVRMKRFYAQVEAWHWYCGEALKRGDAYLLNLAVSKLILFGGRLLLAHNRMLYPYHKWFLRVLAEAPDKPAGIMDLVEQVAAQRGKEAIEQFYETIRDFRDWGMQPPAWPPQFMLDSELNWMDGNSPVDDL